MSRKAPSHVNSRRLAHLIRDAQYAVDAGHPVVPRFAQRDRPEKTANNIGVCCNDRRLRRSDRTKRIDAIWTLALPLFGSDRGELVQCSGIPIKVEMRYSIERLAQSGSRSA